MKQPDRWVCSDADTPNCQPGWLNQEGISGTDKGD